VEAFGSDHLAQDGEPLQKLRLSVSEGQLDEPSSPSCAAPVAEGFPGWTNSLPLLALGLSKRKDVLIGVQRL
jgi:hypothetical protein